MENKLKYVKVLAPEHPNVATKLFGGESSGILNWNDVKYPHFYKMRESLRSLFWTAHEIPMNDDMKDFKKLPENVKVAFLRIIGLLATLDGPQTRIAMLIAKYATDPSVVSIMATVADQESEHNTSYSYILSSLVGFEEQKESFELGRKDQVLRKRNQRLEDVYNDFAQNPTMENLLKAIVYTSILEGLYFYSGFAFFYSLANNEQMMGTSAMIGYINRDELQHGKFMSELFRATLAEHPELNTEEFTEWVYDQFRNAVDEEVAWSKYTLDKMDGIDLEEMQGYVEYRANKMLRMLGLSEIFKRSVENPMKWIRAYVDSFDDTKSDFFELKPRAYKKASKENNFGDLNGFDDL